MKIKGQGFSWIFESRHYFWLLSTHHYNQLPFDASIYMKPNRSLFNRSISNAKISHRTCASKKKFQIIDYKYR